MLQAIALMIFGLSITVLSAAWVLQDVEMSYNNKWFSTYLDTLKLITVFILIEVGFAMLCYGMTLLPN